MVTHHVAAISTAIQCRRCTHTELSAHTAGQHGARLSPARCSTPRAPTLPIAVLNKCPPAVGRSASAVAQYCPGDRGSVGLTFTEEV